MNAPFDFAARALASQARAGVAEALLLARGQMASAGRYRHDPNPISAQPVEVVTINSGSATGTATVNGTAYPWNAPQFAWNSGRISYLGATPQLYNGVAGRDGHVRPDGVTPTAGRHRIRFVTSAPEVQFHVYAAQGIEPMLTVMVDGVFLPLQAGGGAYLSNTATNRPNFLTLRFDSVPTQHELADYEVASGGSGYAEGDVLTLAGGTGAPARLVVRQVAGGAVVRLSAIDGGAYSEVPSGIQGTTGGSGTGATFAALRFRLARGWVTMRTIELHATGALMLAGVSVGAAYDVFPAPATGPRILFQGDSFTEGTGAENGRTWWQQAARRLGFDDFWGTGVGSTGFVANGTAPRLNFLGRIGDVVQPSPDVVVTPGSVNDNVQPTAAIADNVARYWQQVRAGLPRAVLIAMEPFTAPGSPTSQDRYAAFRAGVARANAAGADVRLVGTSDWFRAGGAESNPTFSGTSTWITGADNTHPTPAGHSWYGLLAAEAIRKVLSGE